MCKPRIRETAPQMPFEGETIRLDRRAVAVKHLEQHQQPRQQTGAGHCRAGWWWHWLIWPLFGLGKWLAPLPVLDGPEAIRRIRERVSDARILVLTTYATDEFIFKALRAGAQGYLLKDASGDELMAAIRAVHQGQTLLAPVVAARLVIGVSAGAPEPLTSRELEVLRLLGEGRSNSEIAAALGIAVRTTKVHVQNILAKLGAANRTEAVSIALRQQLMSL